MVHEKVHTTPIRKPSSSVLAGIIVQLFKQKKSPIITGIVSVLCNKLDFNISIDFKLLRVCLRLQQ